MARDEPRTAIDGSAMAMDGSAMAMDGPAYAKAPADKSESRPYRRRLRLLAQGWARRFRREPRTARTGASP